MNMIAFVLLPLCLTVSTGSVAESKVKPSEGHELLDRQSDRECSETVLEFVVGGVLHQTNSEYCSKQSNAKSQS